MLQIINKKKSQAVLYYAALIGFVAVTLIIMAGYIQRHIEGSYKKAGDAFGDEEQ
jgi:Flp pilus assembly pilin Flp